MSLQFKVVPEGRLQGDGRPRGIPNSASYHLHLAGLSWGCLMKSPNLQSHFCRDERWAPRNTPILDMSTKCLPHPTSSSRWNCPTHSPLFWEAEVGCSLPRDGSWLDQGLAFGMKVAPPKTRAWVEKIDSIRFKRWGQWDSLLWALNWKT